MGTVKRYIVAENDAGQRLDKFLKKAVPDLPASLLYKAIRKKRIKLDGGRCTPGDKLRAGQTLEIWLNDELLEPREAGAYPFLAAPAEVRVIYQDENILLADKPPGLLVHEDDSGAVDTLIHRIQHYLYLGGEYHPEAEQSFAPALCNRIDRNTGGIVIAAKNFESLQIMADKIKTREITKQYLLLVHGEMGERKGTLKGWHIKDSAANTVRILDRPVPGAKTALTGYRVLACREGKSLVEAELLTGRTHQIRAQFAAAGHPLVGDTKYGRARDNRGEGSWQRLYAYQITFDFPTDAGRLNGLKGKTFTVREVPFAVEFQK